MIIYILSFVLMLVGIYFAVTKENLIKKIMGLSVFTNGIHAFFISVGYRAGGTMPIMTPENEPTFLATAVDPFTQAMLLTSIVISISVTSLALIVVIRVYKEYGDLRSSKVREVNG